MSGRKPFVFNTIIAGSAAVTNAVSGGALSASGRVSSLVIKAHTLNTTRVFVGPESLSGSLVSGGFELNAGDALQLEVDSLAKVWVGTNAASQRVTFIGVRSDHGDEGQRTN